MVRRAVSVPQGTNGQGRGASAALPSFGHGLLTPLTVLKGDIQLMRRRLRRSGQRQEDLRTLDRMGAQVDRLNYEIGIVLDATHLLARQFEIQPVPTELSGLLFKVLDSLQLELALTPGIVIDQPGVPLLGTWDEVRIKRLLYIVLANALKFSKGTPCWLRIRSHRRYALVEVEDQGIGVPHGEERAIFEPGYRATNARGVPGAGQGLFVARGIVDAHGGAIGVRSRLGGGSALWFTLPFESELPHE